MREIKSDYEHQRFYRKALDELEDRWQKAWSEYLNTAWDDPSARMRCDRYDQTKRNYRLVKERYDRERFTRMWGH